jgi:hypothetical protein
MTYPKVAKAFAEFEGVEKVHTRAKPKIYPE